MHVDAVDPHDRRNRQAEVTGSAPEHAAAAHFERDDLAIAANQIDDGAEANAIPRDDSSRSISLK